MKKLIYILCLIALPLQAQTKIVYNIQNGIVITSIESFLVSKCTVYTDNDVTVNTYTDEAKMNVKINSLSYSLFPALPESGTIYKDQLYNWNELIVRCLQGHERTIFTPIETPALFAVYRVNNDELDWTINEQVLIGWKRNYLGNKYSCLQSHQTQQTWNPVTTLGVLWSLVITTPNWTVGVAYKVNDLVIYVPNGFTYKCLQAHTAIASWHPDIVPALWKKQ